MSALLQPLKQCNVQYLPSLYQLNVRWATKPRWVPTAKTKVFRVSPRLVLPPEEEAEIKRLRRIYSTKMKSIKQLFNEVYRANETGEEVIKKFEQEKEDDWKRCMELNDKWNQEVAIERTQRDAERLEMEMEAAREEMRIYDEEEKKRLAELEKIIRQEKEAAKHFITEHNIDETIERIFNSPPHSFNFAIDRDGRKYSGLSPTPDIDEELETTSTENDEKASPSVSS